MDAAINARRADLELAVRKQDRTEQLYKKEFLPFSEMDETGTRRMLAEAQLEETLVSKRLAELECERSIEIVKRITITSPIDGVVAERFLSSGEYVEKQPILKLAQIKPLNVEIILPVTLYRSVRMDMTAKVMPESPLSGSHTAKVKVFDKVIAATSGTFGVRLELPNPNNSLPGGLKCKVKLLFD